MKKDHLVFLVGGVLFGLLVGFGLAWSLINRPGAAGVEGSSAIPAPAGPMAATQMAPPGGGAAGAPMTQELNALKAAVQADPKNTAAWVRLGNLYHDASMFDAAIPYYEKAVALSPKDPNVATDLGVCLQEVGRFEEAVAQFRAAQEVDPSHWQSLYNLVVVEGFRLKRFDAAAEALARLEKVNPSAPNLANLRAEIDQARRTPPEGGR